MPLQEDNYIETINSYTIKDWQPLLDLISKIEDVDKFGDNTEARKLLEKGIIDMNPYVEHEIVKEFREVVYSIPIIISFDWGSWNEGREILNDEEFDYDTLDLPTKCKLITAIVRNDRFCSGALVDAFESGLMLKILKSIEKEVTS